MIRDALYYKYAKRVAKKFGVSSPDFIVNCMDDLDNSGYLRVEYYAEHDCCEYFVYQDGELESVENYLEKRLTREWPTQDH